MTNGLFFRDPLLYLSRSFGLTLPGSGHDVNIMTRVKEMIMPHRSSCRRRLWRYGVLSGLGLLLAACSASRPGSRNVEGTWGLDVIRAISEDPQNIVLPILKCELDGFAEDVSEYRAWAVKRKAPEGRIVATIPSAGTYYPAFIFYDAAGDERIGIFVDGRQVGTAVADADDNRQKLFFVTEPQTFRGGEKLELRALNAEGAYRTEDLLLLKQKPQARQPAYTITSLDARPQAEGGNATASITWITSWPAACTVESDGGNVTEDLPLNNHRIVLGKLEPRRAYRYRVIARARDGRTIASEWQNFRTDPPTVVAGKVPRGQVRLDVEKATVTCTFPVTAGVPFPEGALGSDQQLRLADGTPLQTRVLERWKDGSLKWVLLDFQTAKPAATLEYGTEVSRKPVVAPVKVAEDRDSVAVDTGKVKFTVNKHKFGLMDSVWLDGEQIISPQKPAGFYLTGPDGTVYTSLAAPEEVVVEESGPVRAVVRISGQHQSEGGRKFFAYSVRLHAWAGQPFIRVQHTFGNNDTAGDFTDLNSLVLRIPLARAGERWSLGGRTGTFRDREAVRLVQHTDNHSPSSRVLSWKAGARRIGPNGPAARVR